MSNKRRTGGRSAVPLPNALSVSRRYAAVNGQREADPAFYPGKRVRAGYTISGEQHSRACVAIVAGNDTDPVMHSATSPVGYFDPTKRDFSFFPEYIDRNAHRALARHFREQQMPAARARLEAFRRIGLFVVDVYDPLTGRIRKEMAEHIGALDPDFWQRPEVRADLDTRAVTPTPVIEADEFTMIYLLFGATAQITSEKEHVGLDDTITHLKLTETEPLTCAALCYEGIRTQDSDVPEGTMRDARYVRVADRDKERPDLWIPRTDVMTPQEWRDVIRPAVQILDRAATTEPYFSPMYSSVAYNVPPMGQGDKTIFL